MSATARNQPGGLDETTDFLANDSGPNPPEGGPEMPRTATPGQHRYTFSSGARPLEGYTIKRAIGRGGFGEVYYATSDSGKEVALKLITRNLEIERRGVAQCMNLKCPHLLAIHDIKSNDTGDTFVIMEYVAGPSLANVLANYPTGMPLAEVRAWLKGLIDGVAYLHDHGIVHRDLKPANLFIEEGVVKIGDYGLSKMITSQHVSHHSESIGTCHYMAPEISTGKYHKPIDIYAIGVILVEMITGRVPFEGETVGEVLIKHLTSRPDLSKLPEPYQSIAAKALAKDPIHRPARVIDLLPPDDAPRARDVRFIGDGKAGPRSSPVPPPAPAPARPKTPDDGILRITDEEPVHYIGPDTRPPRARVASYNPFAPRQGLPPKPPRRPAPPRPPAQPAARRVRLVASTPLPPPEPPAPPPPLPVGRARVGELATSLFWSAPLAGLVSLAAATMLQVDPTERPQDLAFLFATTLAASWAALAGNKYSEPCAGCMTSRRIVQLVIGIALGVGAYVLSDWMLLEPAASARDRVITVHWSNTDVSLGSMPRFLAYATYFGLVAFGVDWWTMTNRDRKARFRIWPTIKATALAAIPAVLLIPPDERTLALPAVTLTAIVLQLVSPWSEPAALYTRYVKASKGRVA